MFRNLPGGWKLELGSVLLTSKFEDLLLNRKDAKNRAGIAVIHIVRHTYCMSYEVIRCHSMSSCSVIMFAVFSVSRHVL